MAGTTLKAQLAAAPSVTERPAFVEWARGWRGAESIAARRAAEDRAVELLDAAAGEMTRDQANELASYLNTDWRDGIERHDRFSPAFVGASWDKVTVDLNRFNDQVAQLWRGDEKEALAATEAIFLDAAVLPGAGRSFPTMLLYLRDREKYAIFLTATARGIAVLDGTAVLRRSSGIKGFLTFCERVQALRAEFGLEPQESDGILALAARVATNRSAKKNDAGTPQLTADAFGFLRDLRDNNNVGWMQANTDRYQGSLAVPFRSLLLEVGTALASVDPKLNTTIKTGDVLASIKKRFSDEAGDYYTYLWGAFCRGRKQTDVQLFVVVGWDEFRFGLNFGAAASEQLERLKVLGTQHAEWIWHALEPVSDRLRFLPDDQDPTATIPVTNPEDVKRWLEGPQPNALCTLAPEDPLATSPQLAGAIASILTQLHPIAALVWDGAPSEEDEEVAGEDDKTAPASMSIQQLAAATYLPIEDLEEWVGMLAGKKRQALFFGPPGTGKSYVAMSLAQHLAGPDGDVEMVQFHPSFSYEDFLEGLRPADDAASFRYEVRAGLFAQFCERARRRPEATFVFIADEINRADIGSVLGELMLLLEYRGRRVQLPYSHKPFTVPQNVVFLATMNTADRSLALVDFALRRRFHAIELAPSRDVLEAYLLELDVADDPDTVIKMFDAIQQAIGDPTIAPGHSFLMADDLSAAALRRIWRYELRPYIAEHWFEHPSRIAELDAEVTELLGENI